MKVASESGWLAEYQKFHEIFSFTGFILAIIILAVIQIQIRGGIIYFFVLILAAYYLQ